MANNKSITLKNITKQYGSTVTALNDVSFTILPNEFKVIMGQSGSGKSTFLQITGLLDSATTGKVIINGSNTESLSKNELAKIRMKTLGFVFQSFHLNPNMRAYENVMMPMFINPEFTSKSQMEKRAKELIDRVGLSERSTHYPGELSGGEQQRVAIARSLANDPDFILADEPTGNLDSQNEKSVFDLLKQLSTEGKGVLVVSHNDLAKEYADTLYTMKDGVLKEG
ncbi:MAG TPA: ABC transporter ATP-binding protein [Clostridiales bacterium]|nr:ABC transporter ATP-binding protein [Clostridiales bacterium]